MNQEQFRETNIRQKIRDTEMPVAISIAITVNPPNMLPQIHSTMVYDSADSQKYGTTIRRNEECD
jgi:hypothetical protein